MDLNPRINQNQPKIIDLESENLQIDHVSQSLVNVYNFNTKVEFDNYIV